MDKNYYFWGSIIPVFYIWIRLQPIKKGPGLLFCILVEYVVIHYLYELSRMDKERGEPGRGATG